MGEDVIETKVMKPGYKVFTILSTLFIFVTLVLFIINRYEPYENTDVPPTDRDTLVIIMGYISYVLIAIQVIICLNIDEKKLYNYEYERV
tara:strand:- start:1577 stop:1846 length:270 start_codon:yes stop_codon:yes gene_type:complete